MRLGTVLSLPDVALAELAAGALDLVWIDLEHGALSVRDAQAMAIAAKAAGCEAHVRVSAWDSELLPNVLDAGVDGIVAPRMESAADAEALVRRLRHAPAGARGYGPRRAGGYGRARQATEPACTVQIESAAGVRAAGAIAGVDGVDALVVGCADLARDLGLAADPFAEPVRDAAREVAAAAAAAGAGFGVAGGGDPDELARLAGEGAELIVYSVDVRLYAAAVDDAAGALASAVGGRRAVV
ncbi:MAG: 4-hydroxy-2-oxoheptanedioate aldolase [Solirubrobacteraceae bacterium]|jgi:2-dehydro-3-deoxyglucarate aldolase/4-hydroxy-2-oxoheptanedioate aldolase|nr:4-hydroxy-2-oxoheptanedioate aldolase [Solirubrobacteraceae bacterium]